MAINPNDLRALADFLEGRPVLQEKLICSVSRYAWSEDEWQEIISNLGSFDKIDAKDSLGAKKHIGGMSIDVYVSRAETCERKITGFRTEIVEEYPADVKPVKVAKEIPVYEWVCPDSWLKDKEDA